MKLIKSVLKSSSTDTNIITVQIHKQSCSCHHVFLLRFCMTTHRNTHMFLNWQLNNATCCCSIFVSLWGLYSATHVVFDWLSNFQENHTETHTQAGVFKVFCSDRAKGLWTGSVTGFADLSQGEKKFCKITWKQLFITYLFQIIHKKMLQLAA